MRRQTVTRWTIAVVIFVILVIGAMLFIFFNSQEDAAQSSSKSSFLANLMVRIFLPKEPDAAMLSQFESNLREAAHFFEFFILGALTASLVVILTHFNKKGWPFLLIGYAGCVAYAVTDEWHQNFVPGRVADWKDVLIDSMGSLAGTLLAAGILLTVVLRIVYGWKRKREEKAQDGHNDNCSAPN